MIKIKKRVLVSNLSLSETETYLGKIEIRHDDLPTTNLNAIEIQLINQSNKDLENFKIQLNIEPSKILSCVASNRDTQIVLSDSKYFKKKAKKKDKQYLDHNRLFDATVLNRNSVISIDVLVDSDKEEEISKEEIFIGIEKKGVKLIPYRAVNNDRFGNWSYGLGVLVTTLTGVVCYYFFPGSLVPIIIMGVVGALGMIIGAVIFYTIIGWNHWHDDDDEE